MTPRKTSPCFLSALFLALAGATTAVAAETDLARLTPVAADQPIPTQDFFRPLAVSQPTINRVGTHIASVVAAEEEDKHLLMVFDIAKNSVETVGGIGDMDIDGVNWLNDTRVLFQLSTLKMFGVGLFTADIGDLRNAYPLQRYRASQLISIPLRDPKRPLVWNHMRRAEGVVVLDSDIRIWDNERCITKTYPMPKTNGVTYNYRADKFGELAYAFTSAKGVLSMHRLKDGKWVDCPVDLEEIGILENANDEGQLLVTGPAVGGKPHPLQFLNAASGQLGDVVLEDPLYDFNGSIYTNRATGDVLGVVFEKNFPRVYWFNEEYRALQKILEGMFPNLIVRIYGSDDHHKIFLV